MATPDKIDIHNRARTLERFYERLEENKLDLSPRNIELIKKFCDDCLLGKTVTKRAKKRLSVGRVCKYMRLLISLAYWLGCDFDKANQQQMEILVRKVDCNQLDYFNFHGQLVRKTYTAWTRCDIKICLKKFYKWLLGENLRYPPIVDWVDTFVEDPEIPALPLEQVDRLIEYARTARDKAVIAVLFETGARAEEFLNIRMRNIERRNECYALRIEVSKTYPRTVMVYRGERYLREWIRLQGDVSQDRPLFPIKYSTMRGMIVRLSERVLGKKATPHVLRHSCATWLASKGVGRYELCKWMGWTMSSDMPDRYIDRTGVVSEETMRKVRQDELVQARDEQKEMRDELQRLKQENEVLRRGELDDRGLADLLKRDKGLLQQLAKEVARQRESGH